MMQLHWHKDTEAEGNDYLLLTCAERTSETSPLQEALPESSSYESTFHTFKAKVIQ